MLLVYHLTSMSSSNFMLPITVIHGKYFSFEQDKYKVWDIIIFEADHTLDGLKMECVGKDL